MASGRGIGNRFALGGRLGCRLLLFLRGLREILGRFLGGRRSRGGGGHLVLDVRQGSVGQFLLRRRPGQLLRRGVGQLCDLLAPVLGQGRLGRVGRLALGAASAAAFGFCRNHLAWPPQPCRLLGCLEAVVAAATDSAFAKASSAAFFCVSASASFCGAVLA